MRYPWSILIRRLLNVGNHVLFWTSESQCSFSMLDFLLFHQCIGWNWTYSFEPKHLSDLWGTHFIFLGPFHHGVLQVTEVQDVYRPGFRKVMQLIPLCWERVALRMSSIAEFLPVGFKVFQPFYTHWNDFRSQWYKTSQGNQFISSHEILG